jgi:hypothetical protein
MVKRIASPCRISAELNATNATIDPHLRGAEIANRFGRQFIYKIKFKPLKLAGADPGRAGGLTSPI